jgi:hypothetical protein
MEDITPPWLDGEKIPEGSIKEIFRNPPDVQTVIYRNALVIGSRGGGKTTYFRYLKHNHEEKGGIALHFSLGTLLGPITREIGMGVFTLDLPKENQNNILGKSISVIAVGVAERLIRRGINLDSEIVRNCIPDVIKIPTSKLNYEIIKSIEREVIRTEVALFEEIFKLQPLYEFVSSIANYVSNGKSHLLLLLDRADMVNFNLLYPIFNILDQSGNYVALVATRPCSVGNLFSLTNIVAGDHYDVIHIGTNPRSESWEKFVEEAIVAQPQFKNHFNKIPEDIKEHIIALSRESIRTALDLSFRYLITNNSELNFKKAVTDVKENLMSATVKTLDKYHSNFSGLINELRKDALTDNTIKGPVILKIKEKGKEDLFDEPDGRTKKFVEEALRNDAFCPPCNVRWEPGIFMPEVEIAPLLIWNEKDTLWSNKNSVSKTIQKKENEIFNLSRVTINKKTIFIAYRMKIEESRTFRREIQIKVQQHPNLKNNIELTDGKVIGGKDWSKEIRDRIKKSKVMVADVTGMNTEVMFEIGFAFGLKKYIYPVAYDNSVISKFPKWLSRLQLGTFCDNAGLESITIDINSILSDPESHKPPIPKKPVPTLVVWYRELDWNKTQMEQCRNFCGKHSFKFEIKNNLEYDKEEIDRATSAAVLIINMDGTDGDALMHFICGAVVAIPNATAAKKLLRQILIIESPIRGEISFIAESLKRCADNVTIIKPTDLLKKLNEYATSYNEWTKKFFSQ